MRYLVRFELRQALLDGLFASLVRSFPSHFLRSRVRLKRLDHLILFLLELVLQSLLLHPSQGLLLLLVFFSVIPKSIAEALA